MNSNNLFAFKRSTSLFLRDHPLTLLLCLECSMKPDSDALLVVAVTVAEDSDATLLVASL